MSRTIRCSNTMRVGMIVGLVINLVIGVIYIVVILNVTTPSASSDPIEKAMCTGCFLFLIYVPLFVVTVQHWRRRIDADETTITQQGVIGSASIRIGEIERVVWKRKPSSIRLDTPTSRMVINLTGFDRTEKLWLIRRFRRLDSVSHEGWDWFCVNIAIPLQRIELDEGQTCAPGTKRLTRKTWMWYFLPATVLTALRGVILGGPLEMPSMFAAPLAILALWAILHFVTPRNGELITFVVQQHEMRFMGFVLAWCVLAVAMVDVLYALQLPRTATIACIIVGGILWTALLVSKARRLTQLLQQRRATALDEWVG